MQSIILASASPRRKELMALITPDYMVITSEVDESVLTADSPAALAALLGGAKCLEVAKIYPDSVVIGCDTVVEIDGVVYGKPRDKAHAAAMLHALSGRTHLVHTGVCICCGTRQESFVETTSVTFAPLTEREIAAYVATDEPYDKAGGYGVQGFAARFVAGIGGCFYNVMGFPVRRIYEALCKLGCL